MLILFHLFNKLWCSFCIPRLIFSTIFDIAIQPYIYVSYGFGKAYRPLCG